MPYLRYDSFRYSYSLSVRLLILLLFVSTLSSACSTDSKQEEQESMPQEQRPEVAALDTTAYRRSAREAATFDLLSNPFVASRNQGRSLSAYYDRINTDFTVDADAIENLHKPDVTDTVYTIRFGSSVVELYAPTQTGDLLLQVADISSPAITLRNNLRVGMSQTELMSRLNCQQLIIKQSPNEIVAANREGAPSSLRFFLKSGKVSRIRYEGYVD